MPARVLLGSWAHGRIVEDDESVLGPQRPPSGNFKYHFNPQAPRRCSHNHSGGTFSIPSWLRRGTHPTHTRDGST